MFELGVASRRLPADQKQALLKDGPAFATRMRFEVAMILGAAKKLGLQLSAGPIKSLNRLPIGDAAAEAYLLEDDTVLFRPVGEPSTDLAWDIYEQSPG